MRQMSRQVAVAAVVEVQGQQQCMQDGGKWGSRNSPPLSALPPSPPAILVCFTLLHLATDSDLFEWEMSCPSMHNHYHQLIWAHIGCKCANCSNTFNIWIA